MSKFHVGDRWRDCNGVEWLVVFASDNVFKAFSNDWGIRRYDSTGACLDTKLAQDAMAENGLVSSERWIPFAEMMPEAPRRGDKRVLATVDKHGDMMFLNPEHYESISKWVWPEGGFGVSFTPDCGLSWRYIQPPEAT